MGSEHADRLPVVGSIRRRSNGLTGITIGATPAGLSLRRHLA